MSLKIYNTLSREKEPFESLEPGMVRMYVCGPTVYDSAHVGHAMSSIVFDVIRRYLEYKGYRVNHVMNYTDVDDKVIRKANELGVDPLDLAEKYIEEYDRLLESLNILPPSVKPRVSQEIDGIIELVEGLMAKGYAYEVDGDVYFRVSEDEDYGKLSRRQLEDMQAGFRFEVDERKESPMDFALWKAAKQGEPFWESPWGKGRPGWHIECSAMVLHHLGEQIDIHGGGNDLIFPHHENEIAQTESLTGKPFVRYWVHNGMLQIRGEEMSKSLGNMVTVDQFLSEHEGDVLRFLVLNASYRAPLVFTDEVVEQARRGLERLKGAFRPVASSVETDPSSQHDLIEMIQKAREGFESAMDDDFNSSAALAVLFELVRRINVARDAGVDAHTLGKAQDTLRELTRVLGLQLADKSVALLDAEPYIHLLIQVREELRNAKQFALADTIRDRLLQLGITLEDGKTGTTWKLRR
ncbi:MAG: cysteine--tRNA ligase [Chloroflexi bacterium RBG_16_48_8]|nr:MAG: cysteine--tRNA ligase [Chloroflexi bacterium RBG_16_48_8]